MAPPIADPCVANPGPLGLMAFAWTTAMLQGVNAHIVNAAGASTNTYCFGLFYGGLAQLLAGMWEFKRKNTFAATAFTSYGAFWLGFGLFGILVDAAVLPAAANAIQMTLTLWGFVTLLFFIITLGLNLALANLFFFLSILFWILAIGQDYVVAQKIGGYLGLYVALSAFYIGFSDMVYEVYGPAGRRFVPLGRPLINTRHNTPFAHDAPATPTVVKSPVNEV